MCPQFPHFPHTTLCLQTTRNNFLTLTLQQCGGSAEVHATGLTPSAEQQVQAYSQGAYEQEDMSTWKWASEDKLATLLFQRSHSFFSWRRDIVTVFRKKSNFLEYITIDNVTHPSEELQRHFAARCHYSSVAKKEYNWELNISPSSSDCWVVVRRSLCQSFVNQMTDHWGKIWGRERSKPIGKRTFCYPTWFTAKVSFWRHDRMCKNNNNNKKLRKAYSGGDLSVMSRCHRSVDETARGLTEVIESVALHDARSERGKDSGRRMERRGLTARCSRERRKQWPGQPQ